MTKTVTVLLGRGTRVLALAIFFVVAMSPGFAQAQAGGGLGADVTITPDVVYGHKDGMALTFDVFKPTSPNGAATLHIVSGGWVSRYTPPTALRPADQDLYKQLLDRGFTVFAVRHGGSPRYNISRNRTGRPARGELYSHDGVALRHQSRPDGRVRHERGRSPVADAGDGLQRRRFCEQG